MMEVYYADITELKEEDARERLLERIPAEKREWILHCKRKEDAHRSLAAWALWSYGVKRHKLPPSEQTICYQAQGKPYLAGKGLYFNLTHTGNYAAAAFADAEIGVDAELFARAKAAVAEHFFNGREREYLSACKGNRPDWQKRFAWIWTRKESYIKAVGEGMRIPLMSFDVLEDETTDGYFFESCPVQEQFYLSVCCKKQETLTLLPVSLKEIVEQ